jgi:hypothetical protein
VRNEAPESFVNAIPAHPFRMDSSATHWIGELPPLRWNSAHFFQNHDEHGGGAGHIQVDLETLPCTCLYPL